MDLEEHFHTEGKTAIAAFTLFHVLAVPFNARLLEAPLISWLNLLILGMIAILLMVLVSKTPRTTNVLTLLFLTLQVVVLAIWVAPGFDQ